MNSFFEDSVEFKARWQYLGSFPLHFHPHIEIIFIQKGACSIRVDGVVYEAHENEAFIFMPFQLHETLPCNVPVVVLMMHPSILENHDELDMTPVTPVISFSDQRDSLLTRAISEKLAREPDISSRTTVELLNACFSILCDNTEWTKAKTSHNVTGTGDIHRILYYCQLHMDEDISVETVAEAIGISARRVSALINNATNMNFRGYINNLRLFKAKRLLLTQENLSVFEIASKCGFVTERTFYRLFLQDTGMSPKEYQKKHSIQ